MFSCLQIVNKKRFNLYVALTDRVSGMIAARKDDQGYWYWHYSGLPVNETYDNWQGTQPDQRYDCVYTSMGGWNWIANDCDWSINVICEYIFA